MKGRNTSTTETSTQPGTETQTQGEPEAPNSLKDLLTSASAQKCTFVSNESGTTSEGTVYVSGGKVRTDSKITTSGKTTTTSIFTDGKTLYMWGDQLGTQGIKITIEASETATPAPGATTATDLSKPMNFNCSAWVVDSAMFELPSGVTFSEGFNIPGM